MDTSLSKELIFKKLELHFEVTRRSYENYVISRSFNDMFITAGSTNMLPQHLFETVFKLQSLHNFHFYVHSDINFGRPQIVIYF